MRRRDAPPAILFVCTGNTCRSPFAQAVAREALRQMGSAAPVDSAGTAATAGTPASEHSVQVAREAGLDLSAHRASPLTQEMLEGASLVLGMGAQHLRALAPEAPAHLLAEYAGSQLQEVPDPLGGDLETYRRTFARIRTLVEHSMRRFRPGAGSERI